MKFSGIAYLFVTALCAFHPSGWESTAFSLQTPKAIRPSASYRAEPSIVARHSFSYLGNLGDDVSTRQQSVSFSPPQPGGQIANIPQKIQAEQVQQQPQPRNIKERVAPVIVQGGSLRTWSFSDPSIERVQVMLNTEGRPLNANIDLWHGPDNTPQKIAVYVEDGCLRPFNAVIQAPRGHNAIAVRNTGMMEFPLAAYIEGDSAEASLAAATKNLEAIGARQVVQGGAIRTFPFAAPVNSIQILLQTDGRPLNARIELLQGPNNKKQVIEVYSEDGQLRPFFAIVQTPGAGNVVRIVNTATMEYPLNASVEPYVVLDQGNPGMRQQAVIPQQQQLQQQSNSRDGSFFFSNGPF